jgi:hypothetical protein
MDRMRETEQGDRRGTAGITLEVLTPPDLTGTEPSPCRWPSLVITDRRMTDLDAALAADPLFHLCPDSHEGQVDVRYWYFHPACLPPLLRRGRHLRGGTATSSVPPEHGAA